MPDCGDFFGRSETFRPLMISWATCSTCFNTSIARGSMVDVLLRASLYASPMKSTSLTMNLFSVLDSLEEGMKTGEGDGSGVGGRGLDFIRLLSIRPPAINPFHPRSPPPAPVAPRRTNVPISIQGTLEALSRSQGRSLLSFLGAGCSWFSGGMTSG